MDNDQTMLGDILSGSTRDEIENTWNETQAAADMKPPPPGEYVARITGGQLMTSKRKKTPGYEVTFEVIEGIHAGRTFRLPLWLTPLAMPITKRELLKIGVHLFSQLERPLPQGIRCRVKLVLRRNDEGYEHSRVEELNVIGRDAPVIEPGNRQ